MIKIENIDVYGWESALRGMRNPKDSWERSDSKFIPEFVFGKNDLELASNLHKAGPVHSKYKRFIIITMDVTAPLYWWKEFDTYKVGTVANSCSTMHKIDAYEFNMGMFSHDHLKDKESQELFNSIIDYLNDRRNEFLKTNDKEKWYNLIQMLPSSFNQKRTVLFSYEVATNIYRWRQNHKQDEWRDFCKVLETLPYASNILIP